jgi:hypothetical protein
MRRRSLQPCYRPWSFKLYETACKRQDVLSSLFKALPVVRSGGRGLFLRRLLKEAPSAAARPVSGQARPVHQSARLWVPFLLPAAADMYTRGRLWTRPSRRRRSVSVTHSSWTRLRSPLPLRMSCSSAGPSGNLPKWAPSGSVRFRDSFSLSLLGRMLHICLRFCVNRAGLRPNLLARMASFSA